MTVTTRATQQAFYRMLAGWACLLAVALQASGILPVALSLLAELDDSHGVAMSCQDEHFTLILTHQGLRTGQPHHHSLAAQALCTLAQTASPENDHVLQFANGLTSESAERKWIVRAATQSTDRSAADGLPADISQRSSPSALNVAATRFRPAHHLANVARADYSFRSTCLLI